MEELSKFHGPPRCPLSALHTQRREWGSITLCGAKGALDCHFKWVSSRCRTSRLWLYIILITRTFLVAGNGQTDETIYQGLYTLPSVWGWHSQIPLCLIVATAPLDHLHVDFTSIETTLALNQLPRVANILVFQDHFMKHVLAYVTPDQTVKTIAKFLYGGFISIFGAPTRLLSDRGASFTSSVIEEMCKILGINWLQTIPYPRQMGW